MPASGYLFDWLTSTQIADVQSRACTVDVTTPVQNWINYCITNKVKGYAPSGVYKITSQLTWDLTSVPANGCHFEGDGIQLTIFQSTSTTSPNFYIFGNATQAAAFFYTKIVGLSFISNINGVAVQIGQDNGYDEHNEAEIDISIGNFNAGANAVGLTINNIFNSQIRGVQGCTGLGVGLIINGSGMSTYSGSFGSGNPAAGLMGVAVHLTGVRPIFGNTFNAINFESSAYALFIDGGTTKNNTFIGGQWDYSAGGVYANAGQSNYIINPNPSPYGSSPGAFINASVGLVMKSRSWGVVVPPIPTSGQVVTNTTGQVVRVDLMSTGSISEIAVNGVGLLTPSGTLAWSCILNPGETIQIYFTQLSYWVWTAIA